jgi:hypothetical protein
MTLERILAAAVNAMIRGKRSAYCFSAHVPGQGYVNDGSAAYDRADYLRQLERTARGEVENMGSAPHYCEPGHDQPAKNRAVLLANWNSLPSDLGDLLEKAGYKTEWSDEWTTCDDCGGCYRTQPDSHGWRPAGEYCEICKADLCTKCHRSADHLVRARALVRLSMQFMKPEISQDDVWQIETDDGSTEHVPFSVCPEGTIDALTEYVDGTIDPDVPIERLRKRWIARMSAPGYMDCTDWTVHDSREDAEDYLIETYDDEDAESDAAEQLSEDKQGQ